MAKPRWFRQVIFVSAGTAVLAALGFTIIAVPTVQGDFVPGLTRSGRWFVYNGEYVYLLGVDAHALAADPSLDYVSVLDRLRAKRINKLRIWIDAWPQGTEAFRPWAFDARTGRFDLDTWNDAYWKRLQAFDAAAQARDIIVEVSIFDAYANDATSTGWWRNPVWRQAWNKEFNSNEAFSTNAAGHFYPEFYTLHGPERSSSGRTLYAYQQALADKVIATFDHFHNVYYEIDNEFPDDRPTQDDVYPWQQYWANYVRQRSGKVVDVHAGSDLTGGGVQYYWDQPYVDAMDFHFYDQNPDHISALLHHAQLKGKILQCNESYEWYSGTAVDMRKLDGDTREAWGWFVSGGYYAIYNGHRTQYAGWDVMADRIKVLRDLADTVPWWLMSPVDSAGNKYDSLASQGPTRHWQILAHPGAHYVVYYWDDGSEPPRTTPADIHLPAGPYHFSWYDPTNGELLASGTANSGGGPTAVPAPAPTWNRNVGVVLITQRSFQDFERQISPDVPGDGKVISTADDAKKGPQYARRTPTHATFYGGNEVRSTPRNISHACLHVNSSHPSRPNCAPDWREPTRWLDTCCPAFLLP